MPEQQVEKRPAIAIEVLPVSYGDCLLISCPVPTGTWRLLVDMGPDETWDVLRQRLAGLQPNEHGQRQIDLVIVSHIDHDHIGAARLLFADRTLGFNFGDVWFNGRHHLVRGVAEGQALSELLASTTRDLPWNIAFEGGPVVTPDDGGFIKIATEPGYPRLTLLSPTPKRLMKLTAVWDRELEKLRQKESNTKEKLDRGSEFPNLEALAAQSISKDRSLPNGSSISVLLEHHGASVLLGADAFPTVLGSALLSLANHRGLPVPILTDAFKLSHHGSRANLMTELLCTVRANHYLVSTDNSRFGHPHDETLARVVLYGGDAPMLWFNHKTNNNLRWAKEELHQRYGFTTKFPGDGEQGVTLELPSRS